nr:sugar transferase [Beijerinckia sp. L45]
MSGHQTVPSDFSVPSIVPIHATHSAIASGRLADSKTAATRGLSARALSRLDAVAKRTIDVVLASLLLLLLAPLMLIIALLVAIDGGPVLFSHERLGSGLQTFGCLKFRTMILGAEPCLSEYLGYHPLAMDEWKARQKLDFDPRITPIGGFLRRTSLDELPQLVNVICGNMSLVGPRPITMKEAVRYGDDLSLYARVRPGITGLWQVSGRNDIGYETRVALDGQYVRSRTIIMDAIILAATPRIVLSRQGAR